MVEQFVRAVDRKVQQEAQSSNERSVIINPHDCTDRISLAIVFLLMYKKENIIDFDAAEDTWVKSFRTGGSDVLNPIGLLSLGLPVLRPFITWLTGFGPIGKSHMRITDYINSAVDLRQAAQEKYGKVLASEAESRQGSKRRLIDGFIDAVLDGRITRAQFVSNASFLLMAGFATTAAAAAWLL